MDDRPTHDPACPQPLPSSGSHGLESFHIEDRRVFISYPWGTSEEGRQHNAFVDRLCAAVRSWNYDLIRDRQEIKPGDSIRQFMDRGARAPRVILLLNEKYLKSEYCVWELEEVHRCSYRDHDFQQRIIPATLPGANIFTIKDRVHATKYWKEQVQELRPLFEDMGEDDRRLFRRMETWARELGDILSQIAGMLHPVGHQAIEANDFEMLRQMLERGRDAR
jgi:internalin A